MELNAAARAWLAGWALELADSYKQLSDTFRKNTHDPIFQEIADDLLHESDMVTAMVQSFARGEDVSGLS